MSGFALQLPENVLAEIAERVADMLHERQQDGSPWMTRAEAAEYLRVPLSRLEKDRTVPSRRWDGRVLYNRNELDAWLGVDLGRVAPYSDVGKQMPRGRQQEVSPDAQQA